MALKTGQSGEPEGAFPGQGCWKFERRAWCRVSHRQTRIVQTAMGGSGARSSHFL